ncbi:hypothetical protein PW52_14425 [Tamlana sedimentorum]|uniref:Toxin-antitoxin system YwqK family antitoxin n=1 Tax=Neotamlana sedimentorum TaxID=1435349 RepID=A0A0D7W3G9_9FLAO|nr:toxin-antitoxin system YwqK family antitoxin [Tamlana sedimentorum]KJD33238.1 hypothetical protein PW52_14425 [Tamlana sedimentorum]
MRINKIVVLFLLVVFTACNDKSGVTSKTTNGTIKDRMVLKKDLYLNGSEGNWYLGDSLYNGYAVRYFKNDSLMEKVGFYNGKKHGLAKVWHENGKLKTTYYYNQNTIIGSYKSWWTNGVLAYETNYENGQIHGVEKSWYNTGQLAKKRQLKHGQEDGLQKAWLENGKLYVNYEAKNGRIFGMLRANSCYRLEDEKVIMNK